MAAADRIRDLAADTASDDWTFESFEPAIRWEGDARWIAALSPAVAPALEGWLREMAAVSARVVDMDLTAADGSLMRHALNLAEAILGSGVDTHG